MLLEALPIIVIYLWEVRKHSSSNGYLSFCHSVIFSMLIFCSKIDILLEFETIFDRRGIVLIIVTCDSDPTSRRSIRFTSYWCRCWSHMQGWVGNHLQSPPWPYLWQVTYWNTVLPPQTKRACPSSCRRQPKTLHCCCWPWFLFLWPLLGTMDMSYPQRTVSGSTEAGQLQTYYLP